MDTPFGTLDQGLWTFSKYKLEYLWFLQLLHAGIWHCGNNKSFLSRPITYQQFTSEVSGIYLCQVCETDVVTNAQADFAIRSFECRKRVAGRQDIGLCDEREWKPLPWRHQQKGWLLGEKKISPLNVIFPGMSMSKRCILRWVCRSSPSGLQTVSVL